MSRLTWLWILAAGTFLGLWDYWRYTTAGDPGTISGTLYWTAHLWRPFAYLLIAANGLLMGHLFGNLSPGREFWPTVAFAAVFVLGLLAGYRIAVTS